MPEVKEYTVYKFEELSDDAKEKARDWWRSSAFSESHDWEGVYEMAETAGKILGIDIDRKPFRTVGGGTGSSPAIYFSGFWSQGDGACFEGDYAYAKGAAKAIAKEFGTESDWAKECLRIAKALQDVQRKHFYQLRAQMRQRGHYNHSGCMTVDVEYSGDSYRDIGDSDDAITRLMRDFADAIYAALEREYEWQTADEQVDESILANEYTFDENGNRKD